MAPAPRLAVRPRLNEVDTLPEQTYFNLLRRFGILLLIAAVLGASSAYYLTRFITPTYESTTTLLVTQQSPVPGVPVELAESARVAAVLSEFVTTQPVLERAEQAGVTGLTASDIRQQVDVEFQEVFLRITGSASTPEGAQAISSVVTDAFIATVNEGVATGPASVTVVEAAGVPAEPVSPRRTLNAAAGGLLGLVAASALVLLYVRLDDVVKDAKQVYASTGLPTLGLLPSAGQTTGPEQLRAAQVSGSRFTEAVRSVRANLSVVMGARNHGGYERSVVLMTSVREGDGAAVSTASLALAFGRAGYRTLLMDCNFRQSSIRELFELSGDGGLAAVLSRRLDPAAAVQSTHYPEVFVLPAGHTTPSSVDALGSEEMRDLIEQFRDSYDVVLLSAPPVLEVPDASTLAPQSDLALIVGWAGRTRGRDLQESIEVIERSGGVPVGVLLNGVGKASASVPLGGEPARQQLPSARLPVEVAAQKNPTE